MITSQTFKPIYHPSNTLESQKDTIVSYISDTPFDSVPFIGTSPLVAELKSDSASHLNPIEVLVVKRFDEIITNIVARKVKIVQNFIEIGKLLLEAKEQTDKWYGKYFPLLYTVGIQL